MKRNPEQAQALILAAAAKHFAAHGIAGARVDDIAAESGLNKRMIYHYFGDKKGLYEKVLEEQMLRMFQQMQHVTGDSPQAKVEAAILAYFDYCLAHPDYISLMQWEMVGKWQTLHRIFDRIDNGIQSVMVGWIEEGIANGQFHPDTEPRLFVALAIVQIFCFFPMLSHPDLMRQDQLNLISPTAMEQLKHRLADQIMRSLLTVPGQDQAVKEAE